MYFEYVVEFKEPPNSFETIISKVNELTGLEIKGEVLPHGMMKIIDPEEYRGFGISIYSNKVTLHTGVHYMWYLLEATIAALEQLGGTANTKVSELARMKWNEVKTRYKVRNLVDWDGVWPEEEKGFWNT
jgi:hypothetical protein